MKSDKKLKRSKELKKKKNVQKNFEESHKVDVGKIKLTKNPNIITFIVVIAVSAVLLFFYV